MKLLRKGAVQAVLLAAGLLAAAGWCWRYCAQGQEDAQLSGQEAAECQRLVQRILALRKRPSVAGSEKLESAELSRRIEQAAKSAGIDPTTSLVRIVPESPRLLGDGPYLEAPTNVQLRGLTMQQLFTFLHQLSSSDAALSTRDLRLSAPREATQQTATDTTQECWEVELTICYLIYAPRKDSVSSIALGHEGN